MLATGTPGALSGRRPLPRDRRRRAWPFSQELLPVRDPLAQVAADPEEVWAGRQLFRGGLVVMDEIDLVSRMEREVGLEGGW